MADAEDQEMRATKKLSTMKKLRARRSAPTPSLTILNEPRGCKGLVIIDINESIFDPDTGYTPEEQATMQLYLHRFLTSIYPVCDILIWSNTTSDVISSKIQRFGLENNPLFKIIGYMDKYCMTKAMCGKFPIKVKYLELVWVLFPCYSKYDTVICDDTSLIYALNKENGIPVEFHLYPDEEDNNELMKLVKYLEWLAVKRDVNRFAHTYWRDYVASGFRTNKRKRIE